MGIGPRRRSGDVENASSFCHPERRRISHCPKTRFCAPSSDDRENRFSLALVANAQPMSLMNNKPHPLKDLPGFSYWSLLPCHLLTAPSAALTAPDLIIVFNRNLPESQEVAAYYAGKRQVPLDNLVGVDVPTSEDMSRQDYDEKLVPPVKAMVDRLQGQGQDPGHSAGLRHPPPGRVSSRHQTRHGAQVPGNRQGQGIPGPGGAVGPSTGPAYRRR